VTNLLTREARPEDAEAIVGILNPIIQAGTFTVFDAPLTVDAERRYLLAFPARGVFQVAQREDDGQIVGFQSMEPFASYTRAFDHVGVLGTYVAAESRRQGVSTRLFEATLSVALEKGYEKIFTYVRADNDAALRMYERQGFCIVGTAHRHARIGGRYVDEIVIEKILKNG
jgi:L-amino acid N-acyltransferase YncA